MGRLPSTPKASTASLPPRLLRLLPAGATVAGQDSHPLEDSAFARRTLMKSVYLTRHKTPPFRPVPRQINLVGLNRRGGRCMGNVRSARRAGNGRNCLDEAEAPTIGHIGRIGERVGSSGGGRVCGPRRRGVGSRPSLQCDTQPGAGAAIRLCGLAPCPSCLGGTGLT